MSQDQHAPVPTMFKRIDKALAMPGKARKVLYMIWVLVQDMIRCDLGKQASAMAYVTLLSLIPSLVAVFCVISLFTPLVGKDSILIDHFRGYILENLAAGSGESVISKLDEMLRGLSLSKIGWSSFAGVLVTLILLLRQIEEALNRIWLVRKARNLFSRFMYFWTFLTLGMLTIGIVVGATAGLSIAKTFMSTASSLPKGNAVVSGLLTWGGGLIFFFFMYKVVPNCYVRARYAAIGAAISSVLVIQGGRLYALFVKSSTSYQTLYGALAALPLFLTWLYICWIIILLGAVIAWRLEQGFPLAKDEDTLDTVNGPLEQMRNEQVQAILPFITMLAIYRHFLDATGKGMTAHALALKLKMPLSWVCDALEGLEALGYVAAVRSEGQSAATVDGGSDTDAFFPAYPPASISVEKMQKDLNSPVENWLLHLHHDLPFDLKKAVNLFTGADRSKYAALSLQEALSRI